MPRWANLANLLTGLRIVLTPVVISDILAGRHMRALAVFVIAGVTDALDGAAARRAGQATQAGAYFDPVADKLLLSGVYIALAVAGMVPKWFVCLVFGRDFYILAAVGILMLATGRRQFPPSLWGKLSTFFQIAAAVALMVRNAFPGPFPDTASAALVAVAAGLTLFSGIHYTWCSMRLLRSH
jgi:cardiolipin synthase (CMP-forming)